MGQIIWGLLRIVRLPLDESRAEPESETQRNEWDPDRIRDFRESLHFSQMELSKALGLSQSWLSRIERGLEKADETVRERLDRYQRAARNTCETCFLWNGHSPGHLHNDPNNLPFGKYLVSPVDLSDEAIAGCQQFRDDIRDEDWPRRDPQLPGDYSAYWGQWSTPRTRADGEEITRCCYCGGYLTPGICPGCKKPLLLRDYQRFCELCGSPIPRSVRLPSRAPDGDDEVEDDQPSLGEEAGAGGAAPYPTSYHEWLREQAELAGVEDSDRKLA